MGANEAATLDALIGRREILDGLIATHAGRTGAWSCTLTKRLRTGTVVVPIRSRAARASTDLRQPQNPNRVRIRGITVIMAKLRRVFGQEQCAQW
jgi:hypothetical protein